MKEKYDDWRITAYALGELPEELTEEFEMELKKDPEMQKEVNTIQQQAKGLEKTLEEPAHSRLSAEQREEVIDRTRKPRSKFLGFLKVFVPSVAVLGTVIFVSRPIIMSTLDDQIDKVFDKAEGLIDDPVSASHVSESKKMKSPAKLTRRKYDSSKVVAAHSPSESFAMPVPSRETEIYEGEKPSGFLNVSTSPLSTFSTDVDTASYANFRRMINQGVLPPADSIRTEEFVNYFDYDYPMPKNEEVFNIVTEVASSPWKEGNQVVKIALQAQNFISKKELGKNLVFLLDVSGSMSAQNKLPLLVSSLKQMIDRLGPEDRIGIVVYAGSSGVVLPSTPVQNKEVILNALDRLQSGGSTNAGAGIHAAYKMAQENFVKDGVNRVILATDGDFNVGTTAKSNLVNLVREKAKDEVFLTVLGFGMGNYRDDMLERISNKGQGNYAYIDSSKEADKVLGRQLDSTLITVAKDVKLQVEFNPKNVASYRLIGYENRELNDRDFDDDKVDAAEVGSGHTVTALYEVVPTKSGENKESSNLRYRKDLNLSEGHEDELLRVKLRYKRPGETLSEKIEQSVHSGGVELKEASDHMKHSVAVASYASLLRKDKNLGQVNVSQILELAESAKRRDPHGERQEFIDLVSRSRDIKNEKQRWR